MFQERRKSIESLRAAGSQHEKEKDYWLNKLSGEWTKGCFPPDFNRKDTDIIVKKAAEPLKFELKGDLFRKLMRLSNGSDYRLYMILVTGLVLLLHKYTGDKDISIGSPVYKQDIEMELINTAVVLRNNFKENMTIKQLLLQVKESISEAIENYSYPLELLPDQLNIVYSEKEDDFPLFDIIIFLENIHDKNYIRHIKTKMTFCFADTGKCIAGVLEYNPHLYKKATLEGVVSHLKQLLKVSFFNVDARIKDIDILSEKEKIQLLSDFNDNQADFPKNKTIYHFVREHAGGKPNHVAVAGGGKQLTYRELNRKADQLARILKERGVRQDRTVGILLNRSVLMVESILAVWKAGGAYIPIDSQYPHQRIIRVLKDSRTNILLTELEYISSELEFAFDGNIILLDRDMNGAAVLQNHDNSDLDINMNSLSYVIYTSGSTGKPKGVMVEHIGMMNHIQAKINDLQITPKSIVSQNAPYTFDISVWQLFVALVVGGKTIIYPDELILEPDQFLFQLIKEQVTILEVVPSYLSILLDTLAAKPDVPLPMNYLVVTGEEVKPNLVKKWLARYPHIKMVNAYGPTEASDDITHYIMDNAPGRNQVPIGKPVQNFNIYILDNNMQLCPINVKGEICVSGVGVGRGYLNNPQLTVQKFIPPLAARIHIPSRSRMSYIYKTGDLGCWREDGTIDFFGRKDYQVKIRGFRIEPGEIETQILDFEGIKEVVVIDREDKFAEKYLCAYFVAKPNFNIPRLRKYLLARLPVYMVPAHFVSLEKIPLTANGKIDRKTLPEPVVGLKPLIYVMGEMLDKVVVPSTNKEKELAEFIQAADKKNLLTEKEKEKILYVFNDTKVEYSEDKMIFQLVEEQVEKTPWNIALAYEGQQLTYQQLNRKSNRLARSLRAHQVKIGSVVGMMVEPSLEMMIGILATFKAGGVFMPLDPDAPQERQLFMLEDGQSKLLLTNNNMKIEKYPHKTLDLEDEKNYQKDHDNLPVFNRPTDLSHILYTSGTTGKPKGVLLEHRSVVNLMKYVADLVSFEEWDNVISLTPITFDVFTEEAILPLTRGAKVIIESREGLWDYRTAASRLEKKNITIVHSAPTFLQRLVSDHESVKSIKSLRYILLAGEPLLEELLEQLKRNTDGAIYNLYGPTETTIYSTAKDVSGNNALSIGKPIYNTRIYILGKNNIPQPLGVIGELCIGGSGVARGYLNRPDLTGEKFVENPFVKGDRIYKTGDLAKWLPNGNIEYIGRIDHQIKLGGVRIEPGEIENCLLNHESIREAAVVVKENEDKKEYLYAFLVSDNMLEESELRFWVSEKLPLYMVPSIFVQLEKMPLTPNKKINRKLLAALKVEVDTETNYIAPKNEIEEKLVEIWSEILGISKKIISINANFFELGGHSLAAITIIARIHKELNVRVPLIEMFKMPSVEGTAGYIKKAKKDRYESIVPVEKKDYYPLSSAQKRLYILQQMELASTAYNMPETISLAEEPEVKLLEESFRQLIERHESLRTSFHILDNHPVQKVYAAVEFTIDYFVLKDNIEAETRLPHSTDPTYSRREILQHFDSAFDLSQAPLLKVGIVKADQDHYILVVVMHHIISDALSHEILVNDFMAIHEGLELPPLRIQYKDFSQWQTSEKKKENIKRQKLYWLKEFAGEIPVLNIPIDYTRPAIQSFEGDSLSFDMGRIDYQSLKKCAREEGVTLFMLLLAITHIWLSKLSSQEDIIVGTPIAGRRHADLEKIMGMFVNTLALRNYPNGEKTFQEFLREVKQKSLDAFENQEYQFEDLIDKVATLRDAGRNPLFDVMFILQTIGDDTEGKSTGKENQEEHKPRKEKPLPQQQQDESIKGTAKFDLTLAGTASGEKLSFTVGYCTKLFKKDTIERFILYFKKVVSSVGNQMDMKLWQIDILPEEQKKQTLYDFNDTGTLYPENKVIHQLLEHQAERIPDHIAVIDQSLHITYSELNKRSNQLTWVLWEKRVASDSIVGIMSGRSIEMVIGIYGILKAGGAYLAIEPGYPFKRVNYILEDSAVQLLLTQQFLGDGLATGCELINLDDPDLYTENEKSLPPPNIWGDLAYVLYTSGSTGKPKGVMIKHDSLVNVLFSLFDAYPFEKEDTYLFKTPYVFDVSVTELFGWVLGGGRLAILENEAEKDPQILVDTIANLQVTHINFVPSMFSVFTHWLSSQTIGQLSSLNYIFLAGEALLFSMVNKFRELDSKIRLENIYGPTEATIYASQYSLSQWEGSGSIPIGKPLPNIKLYILDGYDYLQPIGVPGELCISGIGLARGYLNRPELTAEKFILAHSSWLIADRKEKEGTVEFPMSYQLSAISYIYKTGDLSRWLPDGNIEFLGRMDQQVKIRGNRVELGEIESYLLKHAKVKEAVVLEKDDGDGYKSLCAYIVAQREAHGAWRKELRAFLAKTLPDYMIPAYFIPIEKIPLTPSGKINRRDLPTPVAQSSGSFVAPRDEIEEKLVEIWIEVLNIEGALGIDDHFFQLGGHSLTAVIMSSKAHKALDVKIPLAEVFKTPTIRGLSQYIKEAEKDKYLTIEPVEKREYHTLSSAQKRLYILQQIELESTAYNIAKVIPLSKEPNIKKLEETFLRLINRHESLRTSFHMIDNQPVQKIHEEVQFAFEYYDTENYHSSLIIHHFSCFYDLSKAPLLKVGIVKADQDQYILVVVMHHIISDALSHEILVNDFMAIHEGLELPPLRIQYKDFSQWQTSEKEKESIKRQKLYWLKEFAGEIPVLNLPIDYTRPAIQSFEGDSLSFDMGRIDYQSLKRCAREEGVTLFMLLLAITHIWLSKLSSQEDIVVGTPIAGRRHADLEKIMGMFVNTLALRNYPNEEKTFQEFLREVKQKSLDAFENQEYQFEELVDKVGTQRDAGRNPLFDVMLILQNIEDDTEGKSTREGNQEEHKPRKEKPLPQQRQDESIKGTSKFDLTLASTASGEKLAFSVGYCTKLFKKQTIERFIFYFKNVVSSMVREPGMKLGEIDIISEEEKSQLLQDFNDTETGYPTDKTLQQLFEEQVEKTPDNIAVVGMEQKAAKGLVPLSVPVYVTYRELNKKSNQLAHLLRVKDSKPDNIVAIMVERSIEMMIGILGILKSGTAYLPIDPNYPEERLKFMLSDSNARVLLASPDSRVKIEPEVETIDIEVASSTLTSTLSDVGPANLAYIIYTSGSTGRPKGVMVQHRSVVNRLNWMQWSYPIRENDVILQKTPFTFDVSVWELFWWSGQGASICLLGHGDEKDPQAIIEAIERNKITHIHFVPSMLNAFLEYLDNPENMNGLSTLKYVFASGEALSVHHLEAFNRILNKKNETKLINLYGPTEATVDVSYFNCPVGGGNDKIPIGKPIDNIHLYVVNKNLKLQPVGTPGELCISGVGLARGYLNNPELTARNFVIDVNDQSLIINHRSPQYLIPPIPHYPIYMTGDLARWLPDGNIEFLGRMDQQVKIRGYRIELGEIESYLLKHSKVKQAVVVEKDDGDGNKYLCAYIVLTGKSAPDQISSVSTELRNHLSQSLPDYMMPSYFIYIENIPLTPSGKVDRKILPIPKVESHTKHTAPRDEIEKKLLEIWIEVLNVEGALGIDDHFFQLGGHSLKAVIMSSKAHKALDVKIPLAEVFKTPTIRGLSQYIKEAEKDKYLAIEPVEKKEYHPLSSAQKRLYILQQMELESTVYNMPQVIPLSEEPNIKELEETFIRLINRHESFRTSFHMVNDESVQKVHDTVEFAIEYYDTENHHSSFITQHSFVPPFDLSLAPLLKVGIVKADQDRYILVVVMHHIISDALSHEILVKDFMAIHASRELPPLRIQYKDFSEWQNKEKQKEYIKQQERYWLRQFEGKIPELDLTTDYPRPKVQLFEGSIFDNEISCNTDVLRTIALENGVTTFILLLAIFNIFLSKISGQEDIVLGTPVAGRRHADLERIMGLFVNSLALRYTLKGEKTFIEFLQEVKERTLEAFDNQDYQFEDLVEKLAVKRDRLNPIFDVMFTCQDQGSDNVDDTDVTDKRTQEEPQKKITDNTGNQSPHENNPGTSKFDLYLNIVIGKKLRFSFEYSTELFRRETIQSFAKGLKEIVLSILKNKNIKLEDIKMTTTLLDTDLKSIQEELTVLEF